jgi:hypothetical protein
MHHEFLLLKQIETPVVAMPGLKKGHRYRKVMVYCKKFTLQERAMNMKKAVVGSLAAAVLLTGCLYMNVKAPYDTDLSKTVLGQKVGKASSQSVLWLVAWGDAGTAAAAKEGSITTVNHMDQEVFSVLFGLYTKTTTVVYGD